MNLMRTSRDHCGKSFSFFLRTVLIIFTQRCLTDASFICSNSFRFDQLCPDPRFGLVEPLDRRIFVSSTKQQPDTLTIQLNRGGSRLRPAANSSSSRSVYSSSSTSIKDASTSSCDFHRNGFETEVITAVHVTKDPWNFKNARPCTNIIKILHDLYGGSEEPFKGANEHNICKNKIGIRRRESGANEHIIPNGDKILSEEQLRKTNQVYFWHNFTLYSDSAHFVDTITNYHLSNEDFTCADSKSAQFVQIVVVVSKRGRCEIIIQQYEIDVKRSHYGCTEQDPATTPVPTPQQFCGSYECSETNMIITGLKLNFRNGVSRDEDYHHLFGYGQSQYYRKGKNKESSEGYSAYGHRSTDKTPDPCLTTASVEPTAGGSEDSEKDEDTMEEGDEEDKPVDWKELIFLCTFPVCGVLFILVVLNILRSRSTREICRGYSHPQPVSNFHLQSSSISIDKHSLPPI